MNSSSINNKGDNMVKTQWKASNTENAKYIGIIEFNVGEDWHDFEVLELEDRLLFGGICNVGFLESGYILKDGRSLDETLVELQEDLEIFYSEGRESVNFIVYNERM
jgi:hypothetical protein